MGKKFTMQASAQLQFCEDLQENGIAVEASKQQQSGSNAVPPAASEKLLINKNSLWWPQDRGFWEVPVAKTPSPSKNGGHTICACFTTLFVHPIVPCHCTMSSFCFKGFSIWADLHTSRHWLMLLAYVFDNRMLPVWPTGIVGDNSQMPGGIL
jgi:hypothetical protein